jgi:GR25 family glycosyltransferase involved in LPS biosynthesis
MHVLIISHPIRIKLLDALTIQLNEHGMRYDVIVDEGENIKNNVIRALRKAKDRPLILQDDILLGKYFKENLTNIINAKPNDFLSLFALEKYINAREYNYYSLVYSSLLVQTVAWCLPFKYVKPLIEFLEGYDYNRDDELVSLFLKENKLFCYYPIPSFVEHIGRVSLTKENPPYRKANWFIEDKKWINKREEFIGDVWDYRHLKNKLNKFKI